MESIRLASEDIMYAAAYQPIGHRDLGIYSSTDGELNWEFLNEDLFPSHFSFKLKKSHSENALLYVGQWGSGFYKLTDPS